MYLGSVTHEQTPLPQIKINDFPTLGSKGFGLLVGLHQKLCNGECMYARFSPWIAKQTSLVAAASET